MMRDKKGYEREWVNNISGHSGTALVADRGVALAETQEG